MNRNDSSTPSRPSEAMFTHQRRVADAHRLVPVTQELADTAMRQAVVTLGAELVTVQARLTALEATTSPSADLRQRVAALERRAGIVPGLVVLPGCDPAPAATAGILTSPAGARRSRWRDWGQAALVAALLLALCAWLLRPQADKPHAEPAPLPPTSPTLNAAAVPSAGAITPATPVADATDSRYSWTVALVAAPLCNWDNPAAACSLDPPVTNTLLVIQAGDEIVWHVRAGRHTVTFPAVGAAAPPLYAVWPGEAAGELNPLAANPQGGTSYDGTALAGSGLLDEQSPAYRLTFPQPGRYTYLDLDQQAQVCQVLVLPAGSLGPSAQSGP